MTAFLCRVAHTYCSEVCEPEERPRQFTCGPVDQSGDPSASHPGYWLFAGHRRFMLCLGKAKHRLSADMLPPSLSLVYSDAQIQIWARAKAPNVLPQNYASACLQTVWGGRCHFEFILKKTLVLSSRIPALLVSS